MRTTFVTRKSQKPRPDDEDNVINDKVELEALNKTTQDAEENHVGKLFLNEFELI